MYSIYFFIVAFIVHAAGSIADIFSSLGFEKFRTKTGYLEEGNKYFQDKNGNFAEKKSIAAFASVIAIHLIGYFIFGGDVGLFVNCATLVIGIYRGYLAFGNFSKKHEYLEKMEREEAERMMADARAATKNPTAGDI